MALKFLNKKGWHTGSLRNIENVWKAEQKHEAEQKKLEELRKQIHEERERSEFRLLQEQAGLVPKQERLDFLYDSGLAVRKGNSDGFKALESLPKTDSTASSSATQQQSIVPGGALFEEKPQSANDAWRKLHSDPLLMIRQREQEALARVKNNPVQMAMIRKSVEAKKHKEKTSKGKERPERHYHHQKKSSSSRHQKHGRHTESDNDSNKEEEIKKGNYRKYEKSSYKGGAPPYSEDGPSRRDAGEKRKNSDRDSKYMERSSNSSDRLSDRPSRTEKSGDVQPGMGRKDGDMPRSHHHKSRSNGTRKLSEEERAARLREMQMDAEIHEEQRWKRLKKAEEDDAKEITCENPSGRNFLDAAQKSVYGADKGGSSTIEESVRRRTHYSQGRSQVSGEGNAFRR